jgi:hypothetical protein
LTGLIQDYSRLILSTPQDYSRIEKLWRQIELEGEQTAKNQDKRADSQKKRHFLGLSQSKRSITPVTVVCPRAKTS